MLDKYLSESICILSWKPCKMIVLLNCWLILIGQVFFFALDVSLMASHPDGIWRKKRTKVKVIRTGTVSFPIQEKRLSGHNVGSEVLLHLWSWDKWLKIWTLSDIRTFRTDLKLNCDLLPREDSLWDNYIFFCTVNVGCIPENKSLYSLCG